MIKLRQIIFLSYIITIGYMSVLPAESVQVNVWDKLSHFLAYGLMTLLAAWSLPGKAHFLIAIPLIIIYGLALEWGQSFTPDRFPSWQDGLANSLGVFFAVAAVFVSRYIPPLAKIFPLHSPQR